jgi:hypothetical protein
MATPRRPNAAPAVAPWLRGTRAASTTRRVVASLPESVRMLAEVDLVTHPLTQHKLTLLRRKDLSPSSFRRLMHEISMLMAYEVTRDMPTQLIEIKTPLETMRSPVIDGKKTVLCTPILIHTS